MLRTGLSNAGAPKLRGEGSFVSRTISGQGTRDRREFVRNIGAEQAQRADDDDGDQAGDKAIFDGRDARLIGDKATEQISHD